MTSFDYAERRWEPLNEAPEELIADAHAAGLLSLNERTTAEERQLAQDGHDSGDDLNVIASRSGRVDALARFAGT